MNEHTTIQLKRGALCAALMLAVSLLAGCLNWSGDVDRYRQVLDGPRPATRPAFDVAGELSLLHALHLANVDNEAIASRGEDYIQALAEKMRQAGSFLPTLSLVPSHSISNSDGVGASGGGTDHQTSVPLNVSANGSLTNVSNLQVAGKTAEQRAELLLNERETVLLQVVNAYYIASRSEHQAEVLEYSIKLKTEQVRDQEARLKLGNAKPLDMAQSQADLAGTRASLTQARTDAANARSALARLIGVARVAGQLTDAYALPDDVPDIDQWQQLAGAARQDLIAAARSVESARLGLDAAIRQYFPSVTINFNYFLHSDPASVQNWTGAISANVPIFSALAIEADIRKAWSVYRQAGIIESQTRRQVIDELNQSFQNLQNSRQKIKDLQTQVDAARRALELSERAYQLGAVSNLDRLTQQDYLLRARLNLLDEQFSEKANYLSLLRSAGQLGSVVHDRH